MHLRHGFGKKNIRIVHALMDKIPKNRAWPLFSSYWPNSTLTTGFLGFGSEESYRFVGHIKVPESEVRRQKTPAQSIGRIGSLILRRVAKVMNRLAARGDVAVIVDDHVATDRKAVVKAFECLDCRLVEVAVKPHDRQPSRSARWAACHGTSL